MISETIDIDDYLKSPARPTIDVRSPGEFAAGHIPSAVNIPLFSDSERAEVGIAYKNRGRNHAIGLGLRLVGAKADDLLQLDCPRNVAIPFSIVLDRSKKAHGQFVDHAKQHGRDLTLPPSTRCTFLPLQLTLG